MNKILSSAILAVTLLLNIVPDLRVGQAPPFLKSLDRPLFRRSSLSAEARLLGLSRLWAETRSSFAYFARLASTWDALYAEFIPRVQAAETDFAYFLELMRFEAHLQDGHSGVFWPAEFDAALGYPPLEIRKIQGQAVIFRILKETEELKRFGIRPGLAIREVDGQFAAVQAGFWRELKTGSTEQSTDRQAYFRILTGALNSTVEIAVEDPNGVRRDVRLVRSEPYFNDLNLTPDQPTAIRRYDPGLAYFRADEMTDGVAEAFAQAVGDPDPPRGIVLDLRYNGGGSDLVSFDMAGRLIDTPLDGPVYEVTSYRPDRRAHREEQQNIRTTPGRIVPAKGRRFSGPLVVLIGEQTGSAAEDFLAVIRNRPATVFVGEPTAGSSGQPLGFGLPGGGSGVVCSLRTMCPDGRPFVGAGFKPDVKIGLIRADLFLGRDGVLEKGLEVLRQAAH